MPTPEAVETASSFAAASEVASRFMLDPATYSVGADLGYEGLSFYFAGRAGVLGDVDADVVTAALVFFEPSLVAEAWPQAAKPMPLRDGAARFIECGHEWARQNVPTSVDLGRLADLTGRVVTGASCAGAPLFAAWRQMPEPADEQSLVLHRLNLLRELRMARHAAAVLSAGLAPLEAMVVRGPHMIPFFGWDGELPDAEPLRPAWEAAEAATNVSMAHAFEPLDLDEQAELVALGSEVAEASA